MVLAADTGAAVATLRVCGSPLSCIGYNPSNIRNIKLPIYREILFFFFFFFHVDRKLQHNLTFVRKTAGEIVAMGSQNGSVYLFRVSRDGFSYKKSNKIRGTQPLVQLDWSSDSRFLQTVTQDYDLVFCNYCFPSLLSSSRFEQTKSINSII